MSSRHLTHRTRGNKPEMISPKSNNLSAVNNNFSGMPYQPNYTHQTKESVHDSFLVNQLKSTAILGSYDDEDENQVSGKYNRASIASRRSAASGRKSLEDTYSHRMSSMNRGDFDPARVQKQPQKQKQSIEKERESRSSRESHRPDRETYESSRRGSQGTTCSDTKTRIKMERVDNMNKVVEKMPVSKRDPSEETIAIFGAYGVTGHYFLQRAIEAGYKVKALVLPGIVLDDVAGNPNVRLITGSLEEIDKVREVVRNASYVVCLLNGSEQGSLPLPLTDDGAEENSGFTFHNLNFMHNLVPILEQSKKCRVLLYEASSMAKDEKGNAPFFSKMVKMVNKITLRTDWKATKKEQDRIIQYIAHQTKDASFNYIITRPSDTMIWDKPSRKKLAASKSQPGPFPITNTDLAEFTLSALRMEKLFNSCPYVVQDGI